MAERCPDCGRLPGMASDRCGALAKYPTLLEVADCRRVTNERLRAKLTKLEAVVEPARRVVDHNGWLYSIVPPALTDWVYALRVALRDYDAAKAELEKVEK